MAVDLKYFEMLPTRYRDVRPLITVRLWEALKKHSVATIVFSGAGTMALAFPGAGDVLLVFTSIYAYVLFFLNKERLPLKLPAHANTEDPHNKPPHGNGQADGIFYVGNQKQTNEEIWLTNTDTRTHVLYLGTTGAGKTEGLKSMVTNALTWGSGFIFVDGKADTDLWASLYSLARRFGRDDDLLLLNYMTANRDDGGMSNSMNPFSFGSAPYLTQLMVSLMDEAGGDNAMWKGRAIALLMSLMPALTYLRDKYNKPLNVKTIRDALALKECIRLSRDPDIPEKVRDGLKSYLITLPGFREDAYSDDGHPKPPSPDAPPYDPNTSDQQHGYLSMQFTRSLQSLGQDYGYIFMNRIADIDMIDVVINRRILVTLIPALEKSADEAANLGKILAASIKGMMGATLGADVQGEWEAIIENKATRSSSPFMTVFDEVGYYTAQGMAVMAAQARSLGFALIFAAQDLPAMEMRVKQEARSITANCNLKLFGKLEDSGDTKKFYEDTIGKGFVAETSGMQSNAGQFTSNFARAYVDQQTTSYQERERSTFREAKLQKEGEVQLVWAGNTYDAKMFFADPKKIKAIRMHKFLAVDPDDIRDTINTDKESIDRVFEHLTDSDWNAADSAEKVEPSEEIAALIHGFSIGKSNAKDSLICGALSVSSLCKHLGLDTLPPEEEGEGEGEEEGEEEEKGDTGDKAPSESKSPSSEDDKFDMSKLFKDLPPDLAKELFGDTLETEEKQDIPDATVQTIEEPATEDKEPEETERSVSSLIKGASDVLVDHLHEAAVDKRKERRRSTGRRRDRGTVRQRTIERRQDQRRDTLPPEQIEIETEESKQPITVKDTGKPVKSKKKAPFDTFSDVDISQRTED